MRVNRGIILVLFGCFLNSINGDDGEPEEEKPNCLDSSHCYLIQGDIARESAKFGKDASKYYKSAEEQYAKYKDYIRTQDESIRKTCEDTHQKCADEASQMAVDGLEYPSTYQKTCDYKTYSRDIFRCENIKEWPVNVSLVISGEPKACRTICQMDESKEYPLNNGKKILPMSYPVDPGVISNDITEARAAGDGGRIKVYLPEIDPNEPEWVAESICDDGSWVNQGTKIITPTPVYGLDFSCVKPGTPTPPNNRKLIGVTTKEIANKPDPRSVIGYEGTLAPYQAQFAPSCKDSYIIGILSVIKVVKLFGAAVVEQVNYVCADLTPVTLATPDPADPPPELCPVGTAMCAIRTKNSIIGGVEFIVDVSIGCCTGDPKFSTYFKRSTEKAAPSTIRDIARFQRVGHLLFWDQVLGPKHYITRYNYFYTPHIIPKETEWQKTLCPQDTYVNGFKVENPRSSYHLGRRIAQISFTCADLKGGSVTPLNPYDRLKQGGFTLQEAEPSVTQNQTCSGGHYVSMKLQYHLDKERSDTEKSLVNAWSLSMQCNFVGEGEGENTFDGITLQAIPTAVLTQDYEVVEQVARCAETDHTRAICGFEHLLSAKRIGTYEGLFLRVICCTAYESERR